MRIKLSEVDQGLLAACAEGDVSAVRAALESRADPNVTDARGVTALHRACDGGASGRDRALIVRALLDAGAGPYALDDERRPIATTDLKSALLLRNAQRSETPKPLVLYRGDEHPLLPWILQFAPEAEAVGARTHWTEVEPERRPLGPQRDDDTPPSPCDLFAEVSAEVPHGMAVSFQLSESIASNDTVRHELLGRPQNFGREYRLRYGYHTDATLEACWRALPRWRPVYRWSDLVRRFATPTINAVENTLERVRERAEMRARSPFGATWTIVDAHGLARGGRLEPSVAQDEVQEWVWYLSRLGFLSWNELDHRIARALVAGNGPIVIDGVLDTSDVSVDRHRRLREWLSEQSVSEHEQLRAALFSGHFCVRWTGREAWVATRSIEALTAALTDRPTHPRAFQLLAMLLFQWLKSLPGAQDKARALWEHAAPKLDEDAVVALLERDAARFSPWVAPHAQRYSDAVRARLVEP